MTEASLPLESIGPLRDAAGDGLMAARWLRFSMLLARSARQFRRVLMDGMASWRLSETEFSVLICCSIAPSVGVSQNGLSGEVGVSPAQISTVVDKLKREGWLLGCRCNQDRRRVFWHLSARGQAVIEQFLTQLVACAPEWEQQLSEADRAMMSDLLLQLEGLEFRSPLRKTKKNPETSLETGVRSAGGGQ